MENEYGTKFIYLIPHIHIYKVSQSAQQVYICLCLNIYVSALPKRWNVYEKLMYWLHENSIKIFCRRFSNLMQVQFDALQKYETKIIVL